MGRLILTLLLFLSLQSFPGVLAQESGLGKESVETIVLTKKKKVPFAVRHPKIHKAERRIRHVAQKIAATIAPWAQIVGGVAQVATFFKL